MHGELLNVDRMFIEPAQQSPQRFRPAIAGNPQGQVLVVPRGAVQDPRRRVEFTGVGEPEPDVATETQDMEGVGRFGWVTDPEGNRVELWQPD